MRTDKKVFKSIALAALLGIGFITNGIAQDTSTIVTPETKAPVILSTTPADGDMKVDHNSSIEITFDREMDETTIDDTSLLLHTTSNDLTYNKHSEMMEDQIKDRSAIDGSENNWQDTADSMNGTISYSNKVAVFKPDTKLDEGTLYTFTVKSSVKDLKSVALEDDHTWSFRTTGRSDSTYSDLQNDNYSMVRNQFNESTTNSAGATQNSVNNMIDLGTAGQFVILAKTTINNESTSRITGLTGEGSATESLNTETNDAYSVRQNTLIRNAMAQNTMVQEDQSNAASPDVTDALDDMMSAYSDASMQNGDNSTSQMSENFHDAELSSGIHEWSDSLNIDSDVTLFGGADDVWVFKVGNNLTVNENTMLTLNDGVQAENIYWVVDGEVTIGENANFEGIILSRNQITLEKGANLNGRMFSQTSITLNDNTVTEPGNMTGQRTSTNR